MLIIFFVSETFEKKVSSILNFMSGFICLIMSCASNRLIETLVDDKSQKLKKKSRFTTIYIF